MGNNIDLNLSSRGEDLMFQRIRNRLLSCMLLLGGDRNELMHHIAAWGDIANDQQTLEELDSWIEERKHKLQYALSKTDEVCRL